jgi:hypothetical protein
MIPPKVPSKGDGSFHRWRGLVTYSFAKINRTCNANFRRQAVESMTDIEAQAAPCKHPSQRRKRLSFTRIAKPNRNSTRSFLPKSKEQLESTYVMSCIHPKLRLGAQHPEGGYMVTIYTERGPAAEVLIEEKNTFNFGRLAAITLGTGLLLSLVAAFNLSSDVNDLTQNKVPYIQNRVAMLQLPAQR